MNNEQLQRIKNELSPDKETVDNLRLRIDEIYCEPAKQINKNVSSYKKFVALAACAVLCIAAVLAFGTNKRNINGAQVDLTAASTGMEETQSTVNSENYLNTTSPAIVSDSQQSTSNAAETVDSISSDTASHDSTTMIETNIIKQWAEMTMPEKFTSMILDGHDFSIRSFNPVDTSLLGASLREAQVSGYDVYTDTTYTDNCTIYEINGISLDAACAVKYSSGNELYPFINNNYSAETLGELINDFCLDQYMSAGTIYYEYLTDEKSVFSRYSAPNVNDVRSMLFSDTSLNDLGYDMFDSQFTTGIERLSISCSISPVGVENMSLTVSRNGYLLVNLNFGMCFFIGEQKANEFFEYVETNCPVQSQEIYTSSAQSDIGSELTSSELTSPAYSPDSNNTTTSVAPTSVASSSSYTVTQTTNDYQVVTIPE